MKYTEIKDDLTAMFERMAAKLPHIVHETDDEYFIIYLGYRISKLKNESDYIEVVDARCSDYYKPLTEELLNECMDLGFEKFCDTQQIARDYGKIDNLTSRIGKLIANSELTTTLVDERRYITKRIQRLINKKY